MSVLLDKLNIKELSDTKLRDEILKAEEQIKILNMTKSEYLGFLKILRSEQEKRQITDLRRGGN